MRINLTRKKQPGSMPTEIKTKFKLFVGVLFVVMMLVLGGCGNKGDLYLPEKDDTQNQASLTGEGQSKS